MVRVAIALILLVLVPSGALAEKRIALLIGNQGYNAKVGPLKNPHNDVALVGAALGKLGFQTTGIKDAGYKAIDTALKLHIQEARKAGKDTISFVYYSGHGAANPETRINYLIPVDVADAEDSSIWINSFELTDVIDKLRSQTPEATHYVVFDACRDELQLTKAGTKALGSDKGFMPVANTAGVMIAYATAPGRTASDVGHGSGPYASALAEDPREKGDWPRSLVVLSSAPCGLPRRGNISAFAAHVQAVHRGIRGGLSSTQRRAFPARGAR
jgi:uncharacterized caspase-like protein